MTHNLLFQNTAELITIRTVELILLCQGKTQPRKEMLRKRAYGYRRECGKGFFLPNHLRHTKKLADLSKKDSLTIEEESIGTKTSIDSDCNTCQERGPQLGLTPSKCQLAQSNSYLTTKLSNNLIKKLN